MGLKTKQNGGLVRDPSVLYRAFPGLMLMLYKVLSMVVVNGSHVFVNLVNNFQEVASIPSKVHPARVSCKHTWPG